MLLVKLIAFLVVFLLFARIACSAPTPIPDDKFLPFCVGSTCCGELARVSGKYVWRDCQTFEDWLKARAIVRCSTTGVVTELSCPGGQLTIDTKPVAR